MRSWKKYLVLLSGAVLALAFMNGCVVRVRPESEVAVEPGYYYDEPYVDVYHVYHPRAYYYYHDGFWDHRGYVPRGYVPRSRAYYYHGYRH